MRKLWIAIGIVAGAVLILAVPALSQGPALPPGEFWIEFPN